MNSMDDKTSDMEKNEGNDVLNNVPPEGALPDASIEEEDIVAKLEAELADSRDKYLRLYSDFENYKKRVSRDRIEQSRMAGADIFLAFLPVIDDLERAMQSMENATDPKPVKEGVKLIYAKIKSLTEAKGLKPMDAKGKPFDPELHDAIANIPAEDDSSKGLVMDEIEKGYFLNDKVVRHAKVIVAN